MNELTTIQAQLPDTIEDLTQFVLVGKAKLQAYMLKLQTVNKLSVAQEIRDQTLGEAQEISNALIAAEQRIGELLLAMPTAQGLRKDITSATRSDEVKTKSETISEMGYDRHEASDYQQMAKYPEVVQKVIEEALANGEIVTKTQVLKEIKAVKDQAKKEAEDNSRHIKEKLDAQDLRLKQLEALRTKKEDEIRAEREKSKNAADKLKAEKNKTAKLKEEIASLKEQLEDVKDEVSVNQNVGNNPMSELINRIGKTDMDALIVAAHDGRIIVIENDMDGCVAELASMLGIRTYSKGDIFTLTLSDE